MCPLKKSGIRPLPPGPVTPASPVIPAHAGIQICNQIPTTYFVENVTPLAPRFFTSTPLGSTLPYRIRMWIMNRELSGMDNLC